MTQVKGVKNIRLYMENGTYVTTDEEGLFHFEGVRPGTHVVQGRSRQRAGLHGSDPCIRNSRFAGRSFSQFVDEQAGSLWRTDFYLRRTPPRQGPVGVRILPQTHTEHIRAKTRQISKVTGHFDTRKAEVLGDTQGSLDQLVSGLRGRSISHINVVGHTRHRAHCARASRRVRRQLHPVRGARAQRGGLSAPGAGPACRQGQR